LYEPQTDSQLDALVVEGLVTNDAGPFTVKLSRAVAYNSTTLRKPVAGATLLIKDNKGQSFSLKEKDSGSYQTPENFLAVIGNSYLLHIKTREGDTFESNPQELLPVQNYDSIHGFLSQKTSLDASNSTRLVDGINLLADLPAAVDQASIPYSRFKSSIMLQYNYYWPFTENDDWVTYLFAWNTYNIYDIENLTGTKYNTTGALKNHVLGFIPINSFDYGIGILSISYYYLTINQYTLNLESYRYYEAMNKQLTSNARIFDPITSQIYGNIKCINNPLKKVFGMFEVSSVHKSAYLTTFNTVSKFVKFTRVPYLNISANGKAKMKILNASKDYGPKGPPPPIPESEDVTPSWWHHK
jgi:hypothetical protein